METKLLFFNFIKFHSRSIPPHTRWRGISAAVAPSEAATDITARDMTTDETGRARYRHDMHGKTVRMRGTVRSIH